VCNVILVDTSAIEMIILLKILYSSASSSPLFFWFHFISSFQPSRPARLHFSSSTFIFSVFSEGGAAQQKASLLSWTYYMCVYKCKPFREETWHRIDKQQTIGALTSLSKVCIIKSKRTLKPHTQGCSGLRIQD
jgi:hypothetical protein